jgi:Fe-S oxidoreductase
MGIFDTLKKYKWMLPLIQDADRNVRRKLLKNVRKKKDNFYPEGEFHADIKNLINCMLCPNMCRFDCGTLKAAEKETIGPAYKSRIGYYLTTGKIDPNDPANKEFVDLMYKCTNEENCKIWCPFEFSVVSLLETVRDDLNEKGLMPDYCTKQIDKLHNTGTIEEENIFKTYAEKGIENIETEGDDDVFYYVGCEMMKFPEVVKANIAFLKKAGVKFSTNFDQKVCCGAPALNIRDKGTVQMLADKNMELIKKTGADIVVSDCPGCVNALKNRYQKFGVGIETQKPSEEEDDDSEEEEESETIIKGYFEDGPKIIHIVEYIKNMVEEGELRFNEIPEKYHKVTIHDPCLHARNLNDTTSIRTILENIPNLEIVESVYNKDFGHCCGWSGTVHWADTEISIKEAQNRIDELKETGARVIITTCPTCELGLAYGISEEDKDSIEIIDLSELISKAIQ